MAMAAALVDDNTAARVAVHEVEQSPDRLSLSPRNRISLAALSAGVLGGFLGLSHGASMTGLRFRAENAHRLPTSERGWYFYHKSKNYAVMLGGVKEAVRMSARLAIWTGLFLTVEQLLDMSRKSRDAFSTVCAGLTTAGAFSIYNRLPLSTAARMTRVGLLAGVSYGVAQDAVALLQGKRVGYVELMRRAFGSANGNTVQGELPLQA